MPIVIKTSTTSKTIHPSEFGNEKELEKLLEDHPELLGEDAGQTIAFVSSQVNLPDAGILDLLFVTSEGLPVAVEVKLSRNGESRREVVAQAIDYLSSLTGLTVDELDNLVGNELDKALHSFAADDDSEFDRTWTAVGRNLRDGHAKLVVALDEAPLALERIFRFLARNSDLDVQLLTVQRHSDPDGSEIFVPRLLVNPASEPGRTAPAGRKTFSEKDVIRVINKDHSYKGLTARRFEVLRNGMTVEEFTATSKEKVDAKRSGRAYIADFLTKGVKDGLIAVDKPTS